MAKRAHSSRLQIEINQVAIYATVDTAEEFAARLAPFDVAQRTLVYLRILSEGFDHTSGLHSFFYFWRGRHAIQIRRALEQAGLTEKHRLFSEAMSLFGDVYPMDDAQRAAHFGWSTPSRELNDFDRQLLAIDIAFRPVADLMSAIEKSMRAVPTLRVERGRQEDKHVVASFRKVVATIETKASPVLRAQFKRFDQALMRQICEQGVRVVEAPLNEPLRTQGMPTLVFGDIDCTTVDLAGTAETDDGGSLLIVLGNIHCDNFLNAFETAVFVDGDLVARSAVVNGFEHASLTVAGKLTAKLFVGFDIWAEVGRGADIEYGDGYCLPIGWDSGDGDASRQAIRPTHSRQETVDRFGALDAAGLAEAIRNGGNALKPPRL